MKPVFVKGHLSFTVDGARCEFVHQNISVHGVNGLPWGALNRAESLGRELAVELRIPGEPPLAFQTQATITRELSLNSSQMGLKFLLDAVQKSALAQRISKFGFYPTDYVRKYPRIPSSAMIQTFPLHALITVPIEYANPENLVPEVVGTPMVFDVVNLSPNGVLLLTENHLAFSLSPGDRVEMVLEPRGWFPSPVKVVGLLCRLNDELNPATNNLVRYAGVKFASVDPANRDTFLRLLKDILERLKSSEG